MNEIEIKECAINNMNDSFGRMHGAILVAASGIMYDGIPDKNSAVCAALMLAIEAGEKDFRELYYATDDHSCPFPSRMCLEYLRHFGDLEITAVNTEMITRKSTLQKLLV